MADLHKRPHILIVDDDSDFTSDLRILLSSEFNIDIASDTREAESKLLASSPECILLDVHMPQYFGDNPELEGINFLDAMLGSKNAKQRGAFIPVLIISSYSGEITHRIQYMDQVDALFTKPPDINSLKSAIWDAISHSRGKTEENVH